MSIGVLNSAKVKCARIESMHRAKTQWKRNIRIIHKVKGWPCFTELGDVRSTDVLVSFKGKSIVYT